jgi:hypothetical protein
VGGGGRVSQGKVFEKKHNERGMGHTPIILALWKLK